MAGVPQTRAFQKVGEIVQAASEPRVPEAEALALAQAVEAQLATLPTELRVTDLDTYQKVKASLPVLKRAEDGWTRLYDPIKAFFYKKWKKECDEEAAKVKPLQQVRQAWQRELYRFEQEQDRLKRERERALAEAERQRLEDQALAEAAALEAHAPEMAAQIVAQAIAAPPPTVVLPSVTAAVDVKGVGKSRPRWVWRYAGAADHETPWHKLTPEARQRIMTLLPREYLMPNESAISRVVTGMDGNVKIPGVEVFDIGSTAVRG